MKSWKYLIGIFLVASVAMAAKVTDNILILGDQNPATDKEIQMGDGRVKWDQATSKLKFSNDGGSNFTDIGSGSGGAGGINLLTVDDNPTFEVGNPPSSFTASGGTFIAETGAPGFGDQSGSWDSSAAAQTLDSSLKAIATGLEGRACNAKIQYKYASGASGDLKFQVLDSGAGVVAEKDIDVSSVWAEDILLFTCPSSDSLKIRILSVAADPGIILLDNFELGQSAFVYATPKNSIQTKVLTASVTLNTTLGDLTFSNLEIGQVYELNAQFVLVTDDASTDDDVRVTAYNGATVLGSARQLLREATDTNGDQMHYQIVSKFTATSDSVTFVTTLASSASYVFGDNTKSASFAQLEKRNDLAGAVDEGITLETIGQEWVGGIGQGSNYEIGNTTSGGVVEMTSASFALSNLKGDAKIACADGEAPSGSTCTGNESVGVAITPKISGNYEVCFSAANRIIGAGGTGVQNIFYISQVDPTTGATILLGLKVDHTGDFSTGTHNQYKQINLCNDFYLTAGTETAFKLKVLRSQLTAAVTNNEASSLSHGVLGARNFEFSIRNKDQQFPTPVFTDLQNSLNSKVENAAGNSEGTIVFGALISDIGGVPTVFHINGDWVDSVSDLGVGQVQYNVTPGLIKDYTCSCTTRSTNSTCILIGSGGGVATNIQYNTYNGAGTLADMSAHLVCVGKKQ